MRGPLGLAAWYRRVGDAAEVLVYPDLPAAWRLALAVRQGRFRDPGRLTRGPLGLGTDFESIRDYLPDDDIRQVNWRATARLGRPMSNQYRVEQDRDVVCLVDAGRLMAAPLGDRTRLDATIDAVAAVALVADEVGDRCGVVAFDDDVIRHAAVPAAAAATRSCGRCSTSSRRRWTPTTSWRSAPSAAGSARSCSCSPTCSRKRRRSRWSTRCPCSPAATPSSSPASPTPTSSTTVTTPPGRPADVYTAAVALDVLDARARVAAQLRRSGAQDVVEAPPESWPPPASAPTSGRRHGRGCNTWYLTVAQNHAGPRIAPDGASRQRRSLDDDDGPRPMPARA